MSSNCFVSSRPTVTGRSPSSASSAASVSMRCGASSNSRPVSLWRQRCQARARAAPLGGKKPTTVTAPAAMPATLSNAVTLLAPGTGTVRSPARRTAAHRRAPGSLKPGVPASLT
jgi:hypothetical protein